MKNNYMKLSFNVENKSQAEPFIFEDGRKFYKKQ